MTETRVTNGDATETTGSETGSVLVIDDDCDVRAVLREALTRGGYTVEAVGSADQAMRLLEDSKFGVLLLDLRMPEMDGEELFKVLRQRHPESASNVIFMTGDIANIDTHRFIAATERPMLTKPFGLDVLAKAVGWQLNSKQPLPK